MIGRRALLAGLVGAAAGASDASAQFSRLGFGVRTGFKFIASAPVPPGLAKFTDDFNRANENLSANANWTQIDGSAAAITVASNQLAATANPSTVLSPDLGSVNHYVAYTLASVGTNGPFALVRATNTNNWVGVRNSASSYQIFKMVAGTITQIPFTSPTPAVGDRVRLSAIDGNVMLSINGSDVSATPLSLGGDNLTSTRQGVLARTAARSPWLDDYEAGAL